ncbi:class I adenylate-forming enzyme family protein [Lacrimispora brassicae]
MVEINLHNATNNIFLVDGGTELTYDQLLENEENIYNWLLPHVHFEIVIVQIKERFQLASAILALGRLGASALLINPNWSESEVEMILNCVKAKIVLTDNRELTYLKDLGITVIQLSECLNTPIAAPVHGSITLFGEVMMCTSGSTGEPKIVARTWTAIFSEVDAALKRLHYTSSDRIFSLAPWTHALGLVIHFLAGIRVGARLVSTLSISSQASWLRIMKREAVTIVIGVPTFYSFLLQTQITDVKIRMGLSAGAALPLDIYHSFRKLFNAPLFQYYGCTEAGAVTMPTLETVNHYPSLGRPLSNICLRIVGPQGEDLKVKEVGSICISGDGLACRIWQNGGFSVMNHEYETGDQGLLNESGELVILGRNRDRIKVNGLGLHPGEIETVLQQHPDIAEAVVIPESNTRKGTILIAYLRPLNNIPNELELRAFCRKRLAPYKIPHKYFFVKDFERDKKGQIKRIKQREEFNGAIN